MKLTTVKTQPIYPHDSLEAIFDSHLPKLSDGTIVAITSKVVSLCEGEVAPISNSTSKEQLVLEHADAVLHHREPNPYNVFLTIKNGILIPSAGIDESNGNGNYIFYPKELFTSAAKVWEYLRKRDDIKRLGIIITDSHTSPLRRGVTGICLSWCGIKPLRRYQGREDIFGRPLRMTSANVVDALSAAAVLLMGEANECTPITIITDVSDIEFTQDAPSIEEQQLVSIPLEEDLYGPLLRSPDWRKKGK